jgi:hypothetical protein
MPLPFDRVVIRGKSGLRMELPAEELPGVPLHERVAHVLRRDIEFLLGGARVERRDALRALREMSDSPRSAAA